MRTVIVMPAWNEARGIGDFLHELNAQISLSELEFIVVDDCSSDGTPDAVRAVAAVDLKVSLIQNAVNLGHGQSTLTALRLGLDSGADVVVAVDGDGQFLGRDVARVIDALSSNGADIAEGVRCGRRYPLYRQAVSSATRALVWSRCRVLPSDANTPLRAYRSSTLRRLLDVVPGSAATPNLIISALARRGRMSIVEIQVESLPRRGGDPAGSTWGKSLRQLPSKRFVSFCALATWQWFSWRYTEDR